MGPAHLNSWRIAEPELGRTHRMRRDDRNVSVATGGDVDFVRCVIRWRPLSPTVEAERMPHHFR
jgi:hypothetical protein